MSPPAIDVSGLNKAFGPVQAVRDLSFAVRPATVTGFLGPNGSGKTTTLRMLLGLVTPDSGEATIGGRAYAEIEHPAAVVGAALEASSFHPGRTALGHLRVYAPLIGVGEARCREVLDLVGLSGAADRKAGGFSLGMRQRLGLAATLLGNPQVLVLDEPANGLDPEGIVWLRQFLRYLAHEEGRTVLVSSHNLGEVQATVDDVVIIADGSLVHASPLADLLALTSARVRVDTPDADGFVRLATERGWAHQRHERGVFLEGVTAPEVGAAAYSSRLEIHGLTEERTDLEHLFLGLTGQPVPGVPS